MTKKTCVHIKQKNFSHWSEVILRLNIWKEQANIREILQRYMSVVSHNNRNTEKL
jgi:hypothetical protein